MSKVMRASFGPLAAVCLTFVGCGTEIGDSTAIETKASALTAGQSFLVSFGGTSIPANAATLVGNAGGTIVARYTSVGAVLARSSKASFAASLRATAGVDAVGAVSAVHSAIAPFTKKTGHKPPHTI